MCPSRISSVELQLNKCRDGCNVQNNTEGRHISLFESRLGSSLLQDVDIVFYGEEEYTSA